MATYADFIEDIKDTLFPDREAINLAANHTRYIKDGLIWLQKRCPELREQHYDTHEFEDTFYRCCTTVIPKPDGVIKRIYTYTEDDHCDAIFYQPVTKEAMLSNVRSYIACGSCIGSEGEAATIEGDPLSVALKQASDTQNKGYRTSNGVWTIVDDQIWLFPSIESNERVGVNWSGVKLEYEEGDLIDVPVDVQAVIELYTMMQISLREDCDTNEYIKYKASVDLASAELIWWYRNKYEPPDMDWRGSGCDLCRIATGSATVPPGGGGGNGGTEPPPTTTYTLYLGNAGVTNPPSYTAEQITAMENGTFGNTVLRNQIDGTYQIAAPATGENEFRVIAVPTLLTNEPLTFSSSGFAMPMEELPGRVTISSKEYRIFRTVSASAGDFTYAGNTAIIITSVTP
jgi:hypothetical protein